MGANRFHFADEDDKKRPEPRIWVTRAAIAGIMVGIASAAHLLFGFRLM